MGAIARSALGEIRGLGQSYFVNPLSVFFTHLPLKPRPKVKVFIRVDSI